MDNLTHSLAGLAIARVPRFRDLPGAALAGIVGANLPDVDAMSYLWGADAGFHHRRGLTHGVVAMALLPPLLALVLQVVAGRRRGGEATWRAWLPFCTVAVWSHPLLDLMNTYGVRLLFPLDGRWFYGDTLFIVDPWLWLLLGVPLFASRAAGRGSTMAWGAVGALAALLVALGPVFPPEAKLLWLVLLAAGGVAVRSAAFRRPSTAVLLGAAYVAAMLATGGAVRAEVRSTLALTAPAAEIFVGPEAGNPLAWRVVATYPDHYRAGSYGILDAPRLRMEARIPRTAPAPAVRAALDAACIRGFARWTRLPWHEVEERDGGWRVHLRDARYVLGRDGGFGAARVDLDATLRPTGCAP